MEKTVRVGSSRLSLSTTTRKGRLVGVLSWDNGKVDAFTVTVSDLDAALSQLRKATRCRKPPSTRK